jgi:signal peptidase I
MNGLLIGSFVVPTGSMENTVMTGEFLLVNRVYGPTTPQLLPFVNIELPYYTFPGFKDPKNNDVIVFVFPGERDEIKSKVFNYYLKRCIGIPGDTIELVNRILFVNGVEQPFPKNTVLEPIDFDDTLYNAKMAYEKFYSFPKSKQYTTHNFGPMRVPKKGDTIQLKDRNDFED